MLNSTDLLQLCCEFKCTVFGTAFLSEVLDISKSNSLSYSINMNKCNKDQSVCYFFMGGGGVHTDNSGQQLKAECKAEMLKQTFAFILLESTTAMLIIQKCNKGIRFN